VSISSEWRTPSGITPVSIALLPTIDCQNLKSVTFKQHMSQSSAPVFFPVSTRKLVVMSIVTLGFYQIYWAYKNWQLIKSRDKSEIQPIWRAIFLLFFFYPLVEKVKTVANSNGVSTNYSPLLITIGWIFFRILARVSLEFSPLIVDVAIGCIAPLVLIPVQKTANQLNTRVAPDHLPNDRFSVWNIIAILCWGIYLLSAISELIISMGGKGLS
jgi:hypothetical protein